MSNRFTSLKDITKTSSQRTSGYTTNPSSLYGGVFGDSLAFPEQLGNPDSNHYMIFFINELQGGKYSKETTKRLSVDSPVFYQANSTSNASIINKATPDNKLLGVLVPKYERTAVCIALPVPEVLNTRHESSWQQDEAPLLNLLALGQDVLNTAKDKGVWEALTDIASRKMQKGVSKLAANMMGNSGNQVTKSVTNTRRELMFDGVLPRRFSFTWTLYPKSSEESKALWDIIQMFKYHMLGEYDEANSGLFIDFPNTFDIEVHSNGRRNNWLPKTSTCALVSMDINYTPGGSYAFFEEIATGKTNYPDGSAPIGIAISLEFAEIETIYRNRLDPENFDASAGGRRPYMFGNSKEYAQRPDGGTL